MVQSSHATHIQFFRYGVVGVVAMLVDMSVFYYANTLLEWHYVVAQTIAFLCGIAINYVLSILWVFTSKHSRAREMIGFFVIGVGGLLLSYLCLFLFIDMLHVHQLDNMVAKALTTVIVFLWNFGMRKRYVFA